MRCLNLIIIRRRNGRFTSFVTPGSPEAFERDLRQTRGRKKAEIFNSVQVRLSNEEVELLTRFLELAERDEGLDQDILMGLLAKVALAAFTMLPPTQPKKRRPRK